MLITYSDEADVLTAEDGEYADFDRSVELGDLSVDLDSEDGCLGLIIKDAGERTGLRPAILETVEEVDVTVDGDGEALRITAVLHHEEGTTTVTGGRREKTDQVKGRDV